MKKQDIIRAWRDGEFYEQLPNDLRAQLPDSPAAAVAVDDDVLASITGGCTSSCGGIDPRTSGYCSPCPPAECF